MNKNNQEENLLLLIVCAGKKEKLCFLMGETAKCCGLNCIQQKGGCYKSVWAVWVCRCCLARLLYLCFGCIQHFFSLHLSVLSGLKVQGIKRTSQKKRLDDQFTQFSSVFLPPAFERFFCDSQCLCLSPIRNETERLLSLWRRTEKCHEPCAEFGQFGGCRLANKVHLFQDLFSSIGWSILARNMGSQPFRCKLFQSLLAKVPP